MIASARASALINTSAYTGFSFVNNYGYDSDSTDYIGTLIPRTGTSIPSEQSLVDVITNQAQDLSYKKLNYLSVTADFTLSDWNTVASHEIFQVTGTVHDPRARLPDGHHLRRRHHDHPWDGNDDQRDAQLDRRDDHRRWRGLALDDAEPLLRQNLPSLIASSRAARTSVTSLGTNAATGGSMIFHCWWEPISSDGNVAVGLGIAL